MFNLKDIRAVRDRYNLLEKKYKKKKREEIDASGLGTVEPSELDDAIEEVAALFEVRNRNEKKKRIRNRMREVKQKMQGWLHWKLPVKQRGEKDPITVHSKQKEQLL